MRTLLRSRTFRATAALLALVGLYAWLGFRVAPGLIRDQAITYVRQAYGRELQLGAIRVQPFKLQLELRDIAFPDADGEAMLGARRLFVDFEVASLWRRAFVFREVSLEGPLVRAVIRPDGAMNLADLAPPRADAPPPGTAPPPLPRLWIVSLAVRDGRVDYLDRAGRQRPFAARFTPVEFSLADFRTTPEGGDFRLSARGLAGASFDWQGRFALAPRVASQGNFSIDGLGAALVAEFLGDALPFGVSSGSIALAGSYRLALGDGTDVRLQLPKVALSGLAVRARGIDSDWITIPELVVSDTTLALAERSVAIGRIGITGLKATAWIDPDGSLNLQRLVDGGSSRVDADAETGPAGTAPVATAIPSAARPWSLSLAEFSLSGADIDLEDRMRAPFKRFALAPVNLRVGGASLDLTQPLQLAADATLNGVGQFKASGQVTPAPLTAALDLSLQQLELRMLQPYLQPFAALTIRDGTLALAGQLRIAPPSPRGPQLRFAGEADIAQFRSIDSQGGNDLLNFRRLQMQKLRYDMKPDALGIERVVLIEPYARVIIDRDQVLNIAAVLDARGADAARAARRQIAAARAAETKVERRIRERADRERARQLERSRRKASPVSAPPSALPPANDPLPIRIREVRIDGGRMNFSDFSVQPNFSAEVLRLKGTVTGLSSAFTSQAQVDLKGEVDEFSPVVIAGTIQPFAFDRHTDIGLRFENISLPVFNPYSGRFAGYNIAKGKLTTDLHYLIRQRTLQASHKIRIDQLEWGEASGIKGEATLPVKFATALLRDRNGVIELDIPVTGTLDDPKLRIGRIVWQIIRNLVVKAVTAPFALIGGLFKGAEAAQFVDFAPGSAELDAATPERLAALARGLVEKDGINLDVPIGASAELDRPGLVERRYQQQLAAALAATLRRREPADALSPAFGTLPVKQQRDVLTALLQQSGGVPQLPAAAAPPEGTPRAAARALEEAAAIAFLEEQARSRIVITDADLESLAEERSAVVQRALLTGSGLLPARVFRTRNGKVTARDGKVRLELGLK